jgi:hypothetical protein
MVARYYFASGRLEHDGGKRMDTAPLLKQLDDVLLDHATIARDANYVDLHGCSQLDLARLAASGHAAVHRIAGSGSIYMQRVEAALASEMKEPIKATTIVGIVQALRADVANGYAETVSALARAEVFADFLDMAQYLLDSGYKDAAAVIAGSSLESHLRQLSVKFGVATTYQEASGATKARKAESLNADLAKAGAYSGTDQKNVTAWLGLRNEAAHGDYAKYDEKQVAVLVLAVREFIARIPA